MPRSEKSPTRLFVDAPLDAPRLSLGVEQAHYLGRVLRCREGDEIIVFNGCGTERSAVIKSLARRQPVIALGPSVEPLPEPDTPILLLQALVKSDAMDLIVQKATELGVDSIFATRTEFSVVRLDVERQRRRLTHWRRIAASACEQSGRHRPPSFEIFDSLGDAIGAVPADCSRMAFDIGAGSTLDGNARPGSGICLAIGPEGGFSPDELTRLTAQGFALSSLGARILRAETAAIAACAAVRLLKRDPG